MEFESGKWTKYQLATETEFFFLEVDGNLVPVTKHPLSAARSLRQPFIIDQEEGYALTFSEDYTLPENPEFGRLIRDFAEVSQN